MKQVLAIGVSLAVLAAVSVSMAVVLRREAAQRATSAAASGSEGDVGSNAVDASGDAARITISDFLALHDDHRVLVIDVRGESSFRDGHIPGAINVDSSSVRDRVADILALAAGRAIVTYCSCVNEHTSAVAAVRLREAGAPNVRALVGGYPAWVAEGGPVAKGDGSGE